MSLILEKTDQHGSLCKKRRLKKEKPFIFWKESNGPVLEEQACHEAVSMELSSYKQKCVTSDKNV
jgi:hypothetical protein